MRESALIQASNDSSTPCTRIMSLRTKSDYAAFKGYRQSVPSLLRTI